MDNNQILQRILDKQDVLGKEIADIKINVAYHIRRSDNIEELVNISREEYKTLVSKIEAELKPVKAHVNLVDASLKIFGGIAVIISTVAGVLKIMSLVS